MKLRVLLVVTVLWVAIQSLVAQDRINLRPILSIEHGVRIDIPEDWNTFVFDDDNVILSQTDDAVMKIYYSEALLQRGYSMPSLPNDLNQAYASMNNFEDILPETIETGTAFRQVVYHRGGITASETVGVDDIVLIDVQTDDVDVVLPTILAMLDSLAVYDEPLRLENYQGDWRVVTAELVAKDYIQSGELIQRKPEVLFEGEDNHYEALARFDIVQDIAVGATIIMQSGADDVYENCGVMSRVVSDDNAQVLNFLEVGIDSDDDAYIFDRFGSGENDFSIEFAPALAVEDEYYLFYKIEGAVANVFINGQLVFENVLVREREGHFGLAFVGRTDQSSCAIQDIWTYSLASVCNATVFEDQDTFFSPEETEIPLGTAIADEPYAVNAYYLDADLNGWWRLTLDSRWIPADDVLVEGACAEIDFVENLNALN